MSAEDAVVVTGFGVISPLGASAAEVTRAVCSGGSALKPLDGSEAAGGLGAVIEEIPLQPIPMEARTHIGRLDRVCRLFLSAAFLAVDAAQLDIARVGGERVGLSFGTGLGCVLTNADYFERIVAQGAAAASPRVFAYTVSSAAGGEVSIALGIKGANLTSHAGLAAGLQAVGYGCDLIRNGKADVVLAGGADALGAHLVRGLADMGLLRSEAGVPFRDVLTGICPAEGAAVAVLERRAHAQARGARGLARIEGYAAGFEPSLTRAGREPTGLTATMRRALAASGHTATAVDVVLTSAHATALDRIELAALAAVCSGGAPALLAPKAAWGECGAASGVLSFAVAAELLRGATSVVPRLVWDQHDANAPHIWRPPLLAMVHALCYSGPTVALIVAREE